VSGAAKGEEDGDEPRTFKMRRTSHVFCRCQTTELAR